MSELACELKVFLMKFFQDIQFPIDIACQLIISKRKNEGIDCTAIEHRYIHEYIARLKVIEDASMDKLNKFIDKEGNQLDKLTRDEIFLKAGVESVVYVENYDMAEYFQKKDEFVIGAFFHSPFWLNPNQANLIRVKLQDEEKSKNINIILDRVSCILNILKKFGIKFNKFLKTKGFNQSEIGM